MTRREALTALGALALAPVVSSCKRVTRESILIAGSTTMQRYLKPVVEAFAKEYPNVTVVSEAGGAAAGVMALKRGSIDVATMTRDVKPAEDDIDLRNYLIARDGIALLVNPSNPVKSLTVEQLTPIYQGLTTSWKAVGGDDAPITLLTRDPESNTQRSLRDLLVGGDQLPAGKLMKTTADLMKEVASDPHAIGFVSSHHVTPEMHVLQVGDVEKTRNTVLSGRSPLARSFYVVHFGQAPPPAAGKFVAFLLSDKGRAAIEKEGLIVVS